MMARLKIITEGAYSDYSLLAVVEWIGPVSPEEAFAAFLAEHPEQAGGYNFVAEKMIAWFVSKGYAQDLEADELYLGDYGTAELRHEPFSRVKP